MTLVTRVAGGVAGLVCLVAGCVSPAVPGESRAPLLGYVEHVPPNSERERLPLLVALHGRGGNAARFAEHFSAISERTRVISLRGPIVETDGRAWFAFRPDVASAVSQMRDLVPRVMATIADYASRHPMRGKPVLVGFSQGAILIYELARSEPRAFAAMFPVAGTELDVPSSLPAGYPPVHAFHGERDEVIPIDAGAHTVERLRALGARIELTRVADAPHWITRQMRALLNAQLAAALAAQPRLP